MARFFRVSNLETFQHYKDRNPPWIKLYAEILERYEFSSLPDATKAHLIAIWLLASRTQNRIPWDPVWIAGKINARSPIDLDILVENGFLEMISDATDGGASRKHDASDLLCQRQSQSRERAEAEAPPAGEQVGDKPLSAGSGEAVGDKPPGAERPPAPPYKPNLTLSDDQRAEVNRRMEIGDKIVEICGGRPAMSRIDYGLVDSWLAAGYSPELDIYPTVQRLSGRNGFKLKTLAYFTEAIEETYKARNLDIPAAMRTGNAPTIRLSPEAEKRYRTDSQAWLDLPMAEREKRPRPKLADYADPPPATDDAA